MELIDIKILNTTIERKINRELAAFQITSAQADILIYLNRHSENVICQKDLEQALSLTHPTVSSILKRLEDKQLISTELLSEDHRFKKISLTSKSNSMIADLYKKIEFIYVQAIQGFNSDELSLLTGFLHKMKDNLK